MEVAEALTKLKFLVSHDRFKLVTRRGTMKVPVSRMLAKTIIEQLSSEDFVKHERNRNAIIILNLSGCLKLSMIKRTILSLFLPKMVIL